MTNIKMAIVLGVMLNLSLYFVASASAIDVTIKVTAGGVTKQRSCASPCAFEDAKDAAGTFTFIAGTVEADDGLDFVRISNLKLKATAAGTSGTIEVWTTVNNEPSGTPTNPLAFFHKAKGSLKRGGGAPTYSSVTMQAYMAGDLVYGTYTKTVACGSAVCGNFQIPMIFEENYSSPPNPREIKLKTDFTLTENNDELWITGEPQRLSNSSAGKGDSRKVIKKHIREHENIKNLEHTVGETILRDSFGSCEFSTSPYAEGCPAAYLDKDE